MPPPAVADVAVDQSVPLELELPPELELEQPAASSTVPTTAPTAAIALFARTVKPSHDAEFRGGTPASIDIVESHLG
jgi:hypothetical protein